MIRSLRRRSAITSSVNNTLRNLEKERAEAEPRHLAALVRFAERAYRRPLTQSERARRAGVLPARFAPRTSSPTRTPCAMSVAGVLMSPDFLYRLDLSDTRPRRARLHRRCAGFIPATASEPSLYPATRWRAG